MKRAILLLALCLAGPAHGAKLAPLATFQALDRAGNPVALGFLRAYEAGTTTAKTTYSNSTGTANAWPVALDANGRASVWLTGRYKLKVTDARGVLVSEADFVEGDVGDTYAASIQSLAESFCTGTGGADAYACNLTPDGDYTDGLFIRFRANAAVAGGDGATLNVDGGGAKAIKKKFNVALADNEIVAGEIASVVYDATAGCFQLVGNGIIAGDTDTLDGYDSTDLLNASNFAIGTVPNARMPFRLSSYAQSTTDGTLVSFNPLAGSVGARTGTGVYTLTITADANAHCVCTVDEHTLNDVSITCGKTSNTVFTIRTFDGNTPTNMAHVMACFTNP